MTLIPSGLSRAERKAFVREQHAYLRTLPEELTPVPANDMPRGEGAPLKAWRSKKYAVQLFDQSHSSPGVLRLSICRATLRTDGRWEDGLTWDELQDIKRAVGFGDTFAVEVYPPDRDVVNVANMRHLWLLPVPLPIGWTSAQEPQP